METWAYQDWLALKRALVGPFDEVVLALNTREMAYLSWFATLLALALTKTGLRKSILQVLRTALGLKLLIPALIAAGYVAGEVYVLAEVGLWDVSMLKDTLLWFFVAGIALAFSAVRDSKAPAPWHKVLRGQVTALIMLEFIVNVYTFSLWVELILAPVLFFVILLGAFAKTKPEYEPVEKLMGWIQAIIGFTLLYWCCKYLYLSWRDLDPGSISRQFVLGPALSMMLLPVTYALHIYSAYETLSTSLSFGATKSPSFRRYAIWRLMPLFVRYPHRVPDFLKSRWDICSAVTKEDVDRLCQRFNAPRPPATNTST